MADVSDTKVRIGSDHDGGYVMPSSSRRSNSVLSIGQFVTLRSMVGLLGADGARPAGLNAA